MKSHHFVPIVVCIYGRGFPATVGVPSFVLDLWSCLLCSVSALLTIN